MSVLVCGGKLTYPIKDNTDKQGIKGVHYVENLKGYLQYNQGVEKVVFIEVVDNKFNIEDFEGYEGEVLIYTNDLGKAEDLKENYDIIVKVQELNGLRVSDIQWVIMTS